MAETFDSTSASNRVPTVSVCIPAYNSQRFIGAAIESVLAQTLQDFEIVVSDDASSDRTLEVVGGFRDPRIRVIGGQDRMGIGGNWNRAVRECRGRYIKLLCHDDLLYPGCLKAQAAVLDDPANEDVALVCARRDIVDESGGVVMRSRGPGWAPGKLAGVEAVRRVVRCGTNPLGEPAAVLFRAEAFARSSGFDSRSPYMIDLDMWCKLLGAGSLYVIPDTLCAFRISPAALSTNLAGSQAAEARRFFALLAGAPGSSIQRTDLLLGQTKATLLAPVRRLLYQFFFRQARRANRAA